MSLQTGSIVSSGRPLAVEFGAVTAALVCAYLLREALRTVADPITSALGTSTALDGLLVGGLITGGLFVAGLALFTGAYAAFRGVDVGLTLPSRSDSWPVVLAAVAPAALVGVTALVGSATGVPYGSLTMTSYGADAPIGPILAVVGLGLLVGVPSLVLTCQVLVQGSFERVLDGDGAVVATTLATGFAMTGHSGLAAVPERGKLVGAALFVAALGLAVLVTERTDRERTRRLAYVPVLLFVALVVGSGLAELGSPAEALFALTTLAVLGVAAYTYERSGSLLVPALAYLVHSLANSAVVLVQSGVSLA